MRDTLRLFSNNNSSLQESAESLLDKLGIKYSPLIRGVPFNNYFILNGFSFRYIEELEKIIEDIWTIGYVNSTTFQNANANDENAKYFGLSIFACEIKPGVNFTRSMAVALTRAFNRVSTQEVNNAFDMPVIVIIRQGVMLSLATCERSDRQDGHGEKVGKVTILRDMNCNQLHAGHKQILERIADNVRGCKSYEELHKKWFESFNIDVLSESFFKGYKEIYEEITKFVTGKCIVKQSERDNGTPCGKIMSEFARFENPEKAVRDYVKNLMGRLVFIQFLQKKGWMGVPDGDGWIGGDPNFLQNLFHKSEFKEDFVDKVLKPLFNDLNTKRHGDLVTNPCVGLNIKVPYLNGGLFELSEIDDTKFPLPSKFIKKLLDFFASYNFTIDENAPDDVEIGVDPEMLSRIFENLLEDNKEKGAYYTPKEIVQYMCRESLIAYLTTCVLKKQGENHQPEDKIRDAVRKLLSEPEVIIPMMFPEQIADLDEYIRNVKICDPAIGSGAFPMGLLNELVRCRKSIGAWAKDTCGNLLVEDYAALKTEIICNNIYGVDIERGAIDIACLRFWLSIIVDAKYPQALPNFDYKFMRGNSLMTTFNGEYVNLDTKSQIHTRVREMNVEKHKLYGLKQQYYCSQGNQKHELAVEIKKSILRLVSMQLGYELRSWYEKNVIQYDIKFEGQNANVCFDKIKNELPQDKQNLVNKAENLYKQLNDKEADVAKRALIDINFFDWRMMFTEVFDTEDGNGGFDIVIGNPPYGANLSTEEKDLFKNKYITAQTIRGVQKGSIDTYTLFIELGYNMLRKDGVMTMIVPISITSSDALSGVHRLFFENCDDIKISSYAVRPRPVFKNAMVNTSIFALRKTMAKCTSIQTTKMYRKGKNFNLQTLIDNLEFVNVDGYILHGRIPKIGTLIERNILKKLSLLSKLGDFVKTSGKPIIYRFAGGRYFKVVTNYSNGSSAERTIYFDEKIANSIGCILSSSLSFWFYQIYSDNLNWKNYEINEFRVPNLSENNINTLNQLYDRYLADIEKNANVRVTNGKSSYNVTSFKEYKIGRSKAIIDEIDDYLGPLYGLTREEIDFIKNYEIEFRMSDDE